MGAIVNRMIENEEKLEVFTSKKQWEEKTPFGIIPKEMIFNKKDELTAWAQRMKTHALEKNKFFAIVSPEKILSLWDI